MVERGLAAVMVLIAIVLGACTVTDSVEVPTDAIVPQFRVVAGPGATDVTVTLYRSGLGSNRIELAAGDTLTARIGGSAPVSLSVRAPGTASVRYTASLAPTSEGDEVIVALERSSQVSAPATRIVIPLAPVLSAPTDGSTETIVAGDTESPSVSVAWAPLPDGLSVEVSFDLITCADDQDFDVLGSLMALPGSLFDGAAGGAEATTWTPAVYDQGCVADVLVGGVTDEVELDPAFGGQRAGTRIVHLAPPPRVTFETIPF